MERAVERVEVSAFRVPTDAPEADGTYAWDATTMVYVEVAAGGVTGMGYSYADTATARLVRDMLAPLVRGRDAFDIPGTATALARAVRNLGRPGIAAMAISAVDVALWDLKARLLGLPLASLLGRASDGVPVYGSGGFTSYDDRQLTTQLSNWVMRGIPRVKIKVGSDPGDDPRRIAVARQAIGPATELFIDANGALGAPQALALLEDALDAHVTWFEEPVPSDDTPGLRYVRAHAPPGLDVAAGEYGYVLDDFRRLLAEDAVDVLQADATRCLGFSGLLRVAALADAYHRPLSAHCAPALHVHACSALPRVRHIEYFHDHARIERMLFDGAPEPIGGVLRPDLTRPGMGLELKRRDASAFAL